MWLLWIVELWSDRNEVQDSKKCSEDLAWNEIMKDGHKKFFFKKSMSSE